MSDMTISPDSPSPSGGAQAPALQVLVAMERRLAGLTAAVEGFAARQQELHARDYSAELAKIQSACDITHQAMLKLNEKPAMAMTPELMGRKIEHASAQVRQADHTALELAQRDLRQAIGSIGSVVASARVSQDQNMWLAGAAAAALVLGFVFGAFLPPKIAQAVPESWLWPEDRAAAELQRDGWSAGERMMQVSDPGRWRAVVAAVQLYTNNFEQLHACAKSATKTDKTVVCSVKMSAIADVAKRSELLE